MARKDTLTVTDNRTGRSYELPIEENTIRATDLAKIRTSPRHGSVAQIDSTTPAFFRLRFMPMPDMTPGIFQQGNRALPFCGLPAGHVRPHPVMKYAARRNPF